MIRLFLTAILSFGTTTLMANEPINVNDYEEPDVSATIDVEAWSKLDNQLYASWVSKNVHYAKHDVPSIRLRQDTVAYAWRGERLGMQALLFSPTGTDSLTLELTDMTDAGGHSVKAEGSTARFVNYVLTDNYKACGNHPTNLTPYLVPDVIDQARPSIIAARSVRPVWVTVEVPRDIAAGEYSMNLKVVNKKTQKAIDKLTLRVNVQNRILPEAHEQKFHLDFWQQPYAVSRYYGVKKWSEEHFEALRPYAKMLARAGQKVVSAILFYEPWGAQSNDKFDAMIRTTKKTDGTWAFDYTVFDKWVTFMAENGIDSQINCFSMVPWDMTFVYYDEAKGADVSLVTTTSSAEYKALWTAYLKDFAAHLREKGWFEKTCIAMDERGLQNMQDAYRVAQEAVPGIKMALAGNYHTELAGKLHDYCVALNQSFTKSERDARRKAGQPTTIYTSCADPQPNIFSNSAPYEATYIPLLAIANGFDGFLHWSWMNWTDDPLRDTRFRMFAPGDTYVVYPGARSSVRFERLIEGIEAAEKYRILSAEYAANGNAEAKSELDEALAALADYFPTTGTRTSHRIDYFESLLNGAPKPSIEPESAYCTVGLEDNKRDEAIAKRWIKQLTTTGASVNVKYTASKASATGYVEVQDTLLVVPGQTIKLRTTSNTDSDGLQYCRLGIFADWNGDRSFYSAPNEQIAIVGSAKASNSDVENVNKSFTVPADATFGESRLRLCYNDAWKPEPDACGLMYKGFALDIPMLIVDDKTVGVKMHQWNATDGNGALKFRRSGDELTFDEPFLLTVYDMRGVLLDSTPLTTQYSVANYMPGEFIICARRTNGIRKTAKLIKR